MCFDILFFLGQCWPKLGMTSHWVRADSWISCCMIHSFVAVFIILVYSWDSFHANNSVVCLSLSSLRLIWWAVLNLSYNFSLGTLFFFWPTCSLWFGTVLAAICNSWAYLIVKPHHSSYDWITRNKTLTSAKAKHLSHTYSEFLRSGS